MQTDRGGYRRATAEVEGMRDKDKDRRYRLDVHIDGWQKEKTLGKGILSTLYLSGEW